MSLAYANRSLTAHSLFPSEANTLPQGRLRTKAFFLIAYLPHARHHARLWGPSPCTNCMTRTDGVQEQAKLINYRGRTGNSGCLWGGRIDWQEA